MLEPGRSERRACARVPHHVTAFFVPHKAADPAEAGSTGAGLVVEPPVKVCVSPDGGEALGLPESLVAETLGLKGLRFEVYEPLPRGYGFASSAAIAIGVALAGALYRGIPVYRALRAAHEAEVKASTGLGDVLAISMGGYGVAVRLKPGAPGVGFVEYIPPPKGVLALGIATGRMTTRELLAAYTGEVAARARRALERVAESMSFSVFMEEAQAFSEETGALRLALGDKVGDVMRTPGLLGVYAKKKLAIVVIEEDRAFEAASYLRRLGFDPKLLEISGGGPRVGWV